MKMKLVAAVQSIFSFSAPTNTDENQMAIVCSIQQNFILKYCNTEWGLPEVNVLQTYFLKYTFSPWNTTKATKTDMTSTSWCVCLTEWQFVKKHCFEEYTPSIWDNRICVPWKAQLNHSRGVYSVKWCRPRDKIVLHHKYSRYLHQTNTIVFTTISATKETEFHLSSDTIIKVS